MKKLPLVVWTEYDPLDCSLSRPELGVTVDVSEPAEIGVLLDHRGRKAWMMEAPHSRVSFGFQAPRAVVR